MNTDDMMESDEWNIDWEELLEVFPDLRSLEGVPQDPIWHAEGDVLTHTRLVLDSLIGLAEWKALSYELQTIVFLTAQLHDIGKPHCTREEEGRITSKGHARIGAYRARWLLADLFSDISFADREQIVNLIRYHSAPLFAFEVKDPARRCISLSQVVDCRLLALLAEADVRGRISHDQEGMLETIDLFRELCRENECFLAPRSFKSDFSRFRYFADGVGHPDVEQYDDSVCEVTIMSGLPASGKDHWVKENGAGLPVISLDDMRTELGVDPKDNQRPLVQEAKERAKVLLREHQSFIWNATNTSADIRSGLIRLFVSYKARVKIVYIDTPLKLILERNAKRQVPVPEEVIDKLTYRLDIPTLGEAHQVQWVSGGQALI